ncbi:hypothetical protein GCM10011512_10800 [Tersicoccus solisilvae]|uniref:Tetratricopeptide repeat protein n=1 Tax=Tersicoccus solisilvae TaxID=1882339 RepID=A0ABQ1NYV4_9MICC|nr:hypothetical protein [Tersicoccus solisilvae]GGC85762.1 hypothetical protein GCM10011512_10800 [Tersicoccus solisilvae]
MTADPVMAAVLHAVGVGQAGDRAAARRALESLWTELGPDGDALHRCTLAHFLADLMDDPASALDWDLRALAAADAVTEDRAHRHHAGLDIAAFAPSLHLNAADDHRRLGDVDAAREHLAAARAAASRLPEGPYGDGVRTAIDEVADAVDRGDTTERSSAPGARPGAG